MTKFFFILFLVLFAGAGVVLIFADFKSSPENAAEPKSVDYASLILKDDFSLRSLLARIASGCTDGDTECITLKSYKYVISNYILKASQSDAQLVPNTLAIKEGGAADLSVLLASFLAHGGIDQRLRFENGKPYVYACNLDSLKLYRHILADMRAVPIAKRDVVLKKNQMWAVGFSGIGVTAAVDISVKSGKPFDMYMFPDKRNMDAFLRDKSGRYIAECSTTETDNAEISCTVPETAVLVFISSEDANPFSGTVYKGGLLLGDITERSVNGKRCIPMDVSLQGEYRYPGVVSGTK